MILLHYAVAQMKQSYKLKKKVCCIKKNRDVYALVNSFYEIGLINGFSTISEKYLMIFNNYDETLPGLRRLGLLSKKSNRLYLKKKQVKGAKLLGYCKNTGFMIIRTSYRNWVIDYECELYGIGGEAVLVI